MFKLLIRTLFAVFCLALLGRSGPRVFAQTETEGKILSFDSPMTLKVYLPPNFDPEKRYPTLYLLHGQSQDAGLWIRIGIKETLDSLVTQGVVEPFLVVLPQEDKYLEDVEKSDFERRFVDHLMPFIEENFPVLRERSARAIGGISRGAFWAQMIALKNYNRFGVLGQHSLLTAYYSTSSLTRLIQDEPELETPKIRIDIGNEDFYIEEEVTFVQQLQILKIPHIFILNKGKHDEAYWEENLRDYLIWYGTSLSGE